jgi:hypothetical protein
VPIIQAFQVAVDRAGGRIEFIQTPERERKVIRPEVIDRLIKARVEAVATFRMTGERYMERVIVRRPAQWSAALPPVRRNGA